MGITNEDMVSALDLLSSPLGDGKMDCWSYTTVSLMLIQRSREAHSLATGAVNLSFEAGASMKN